MKQVALDKNVERQSKRQRISEMKAFLNSQTGVIAQYDDRLVRRFVERVTVFEGSAAVRFRSVAEVRIEI